MKNLIILTKTKMKKTILSTLIAFTITALPALALFSENETTFLVISALKEKAGDKQISLSWKSSPDKNGDDATSYVIEYGKQSVAEGLADEYEESETSLETSFVAENLTNGVPYYFTVKAIGKNDSEGPTSEEIKVVPTSESGIDENPAPTVIAAESKGKTVVVIEFSEEISLPAESPELSFSITEEDDTNQFLLVWSAEYYTENEGEEDEKLDKTKIKLTTDEQIIGNSYIVTVSALITDVDNNPIESGATDSAIFTGKVKEVTEVATEHAAADEAPELPEDESLVAEEVIIEENIIAPEVTNTNIIDTTPPEDVTNFAIKFKQRVTDYLMQLTWKESIDSAGDLVNQLVYHSLDKGENWDKPLTLSADAVNYEMVGQPETEHTFKITTKDETGNESSGVIESIRLPALPQTGPLALVMFGLGLTAVGVNRMRKK